MRYPGAAAIAAAIAVTLTGCGSLATPSTVTPSVTVAPATRSAKPSSDPSPAPSPTPTETAPDGPAPSSAATAASNAPADRCADADLGVAVVPADGGGAAGSEYVEVLVTNTGGGACTLRGTPVVSVVGDGGRTRLGRSAERISGGARTLRLQSGQTVASSLRIVDIGTDGGPLDGCTVRKGAGYRVVLPYSTRAFFVEDPTAVACDPGPSFMSVGPLTRFPG